MGMSRGHSQEVAVVRAPHTHVIMRCAVNDLRPAG